MSAEGRLKLLEDDPNLKIEIEKSLEQKEGDEQKYEQNDVDDLLKSLGIGG